MEVAHYLFRQIPSQAEVLLDAFLSYPFHFFELDIKTVHHAIQLLHQYSSFGIGGRDATIIASMVLFQIKSDTRQQRVLRNQFFVQTFKSEYVVYSF